MRAVVCKAFGPPQSLTIEELADPQPADGQVLIDVHSIGLNFPDVLQILGKYQFQPPFPFVPGSELAGVVSEVGKGVAGLKKGDRVMALASTGAMAQRVAADADSVDRIPEEMSFDEAAAIGIAYGTSYHALRQRGCLRAGETLLVLGASGGVGLAAVEIGKAFGARVIAAAGTDEKLAVAREHGADVLLNYGDGRLKEQMKDIAPRGADVIFDPVGGDLFDQAARSINWNGRILVIGFASGTIPKYPTNLALLKGCALVGVFWGSFRKQEPQAYAENCLELFSLYRAGKVRPLISRAWPFESYAQALDLFLERKAVGKVVLRVRD